VHVDIGGQLNVVPISPVLMSTLFEPPFPPEMFPVETLVELSLPDEVTVVPPLLKDVSFDDELVCDVPLDDESLDEELVCELLLWLVLVSPPVVAEAVWVPLPAAETFPLSATSPPLACWVAVTSPVTIVTLVTGLDGSPS
jgi:hypothetical protein